MRFGTEGKFSEKMRISLKILELKRASPGIVGYDRCNLSIGIIGIVFWVCGLVWVIIQNKKQVSEITPYG